MQFIESERQTTIPTKINNGEHWSGPDETMVGPTTPSEPVQRQEITVYLKGQPTVIIESSPSVTKATDSGKDDRWAGPDNLF